MTASAPVPCSRLRPALSADRLPRRQSLPALLPPSIAGLRLPTGTARQYRSGRMSPSAPAGLAETARG
jgi:hypothetical protein